MSYDSSQDTMLHINVVRQELSKFRNDLTQRAIDHDHSKLFWPEKQEFDRLTPILKDLKYGTPEYAASLKELGSALEHHYENNDHHPEHYKDGIAGMTLPALIEMYCDWMAASQRTKEGDPVKSVEIGIKRFNIEPQLASILMNTVRKRQ